MRAERVVDCVFRQEFAAALKDGGMRKKYFARIQEQFFSAQIADVFDTCVKKYLRKRSSAWIFVAFACHSN
jgi:hypothetical protein